MGEMDNTHSEHEEQGNPWGHSEASATSSPPTSPHATATSGTTAANNPFNPASPSTQFEHTNPFEPTEPTLPARPQEPERHVDEPVDTEPDTTPEVASLKAMFPDFDPVVLQSVLESVGGNQDRAIDMLLGMSDPDYVSQEPPAPVQSQTELDEELARRLMLEDQQQQQQQQHGWDPRYQQQYGHPGGNVPYQPRAPQGGQYQHGPQGGQGQWGGQGGNRDTMSEVQEQFTKIAETGKKTFSSLVTKVKAKMQEFDSTKTTQGSSAQSGQNSRGGGAVGGQRTQEQEQSYYDPNPGGYNAAPTAARGYDAAPTYTPAPSIPPRPTEAPSANSASNMAGIGAGASNVARSASPPGANSVPQPPPPTSAGSPIDPSKIGLLPRNPVSLLGTSPQPSHSRPSDNEEEELDYVENPFEETRR